MLNAGAPSLPHSLEFAMSVQTHPRPCRAVILFLLGALILGSSALPAQAAVGACDQSPLTEPFAPWGDPNYYKLAPGGDFEGSTPWSLTGAAAVTAGSEPWAATGARGSWSLSLPPGSLGQSPQTCVNAAYTSLRFFARAMTPGAVLLVSVLYPTVLGQTALVVGAITPASDWNPTLPMPTVTGILGLVAGGATPIVLRFTAVIGTTQIDDVYIDPHGLG